LYVGWRRASREKKTYSFPNFQNLKKLKLSFEADQNPSETEEQVKTISLLEMTV
jgi:hypothetical protein